MNCIIQTKSHLNVTSSIVHTLPLLENFNWKAVPLLSLSPSCLQCFCAFPVFTFRETEFVPWHGTKLYFSSSLRISTPKKATLFLFAFFIFTTQCCFAASAPPCVPLQPVAWKLSVDTDLSQARWKPFGFWAHKNQLLLHFFSGEIHTPLIYPCWSFLPHSLILAFPLSYLNLEVYKGGLEPRQSINKCCLLF